MAERPYVAGAVAIGLLPKREEKARRPSLGSGDESAAPAGKPLAVWAATCYPYLNRHVLMIGSAALLGLLSVSVILTYASINCGPILSRTTNHIPGQLDLDFYLKTASLVGVPLIGFVASQFPEVSSFLFSWLEPGMAAVK